MKLFLDACCIIYLFESNQQQGRQTRIIVKEALQAGAQLVVSRLSCLECRIQPMKQNNSALLASYNRFFQSAQLQVVELSANVINVATDLRANYPQSIKTPDALQLACAIQVQADTFLTGDKRLIAVQQIQVVIV